MNIFRHVEITSYSIFLPIPWFYKFSVWDEQFQYYLWVPNSGLISNTVKSAKNSMFKVLGIAIPVFLLHYFSPSNLYILTSKTVYMHKMTTISEKQHNV